MITKEQAKQAFDAMADIITCNSMGSNRNVLANHPEYAIIEGFINQPAPTADEGMKALERVNTELEEYRNFRSEKENEGVFSAFNIVRSSLLAVLEKALKEGNNQNE